MLFSNQISARELISGNQSEQNRDFSQLQNAKFTQFEMSQTESQDCFSQQDQYSAGSSQDIHSQGRRMSSYERYISKPLFGGSSQSRSASRNSQSQSQGPPKFTTTKPIYQHQMNTVKGRVKEREEKDMLSSIISIVKECSDEVKQNLHCLKEADEDKSNMLMKAIDKLTHAVDENSGKILNAIHSREELVSKSLDLQTEISKKDKQIQELLKQSTQSCTVENSKAMENAMKTFLEQQHGATEQKLQKILDITKGQLSLVQDIEACQKSGHENNKKHQTDWKYSNQRQLQDMEKRLQAELVTLRDEFDCQKRDMESFYKNQLQSFLQKYVRDIEHQIQRGLQNSMYSISEQNQGMSRDQQMELRESLRQQQREMEANIISQTSTQSEKMLKYHMEQSVKSCNNLKKDLSGKLELMQTQQKKMLEDNSKQFELLKETLQSSDRPWQNENVPLKVQEQLNELHDNHMAEIKRLEKEIEKERKEKELKMLQEQRSRSTLECTSPFENVYDFMANESVTKRDDTTHRKSVGSMFGKATSFLSPRPPTGMTWNSKALFGRTNPSPVATVLPQRKSVPLNQSKADFTEVSSDQINHLTVKPQRQLRSNTKQIIPSYRDQIQLEEESDSQNNTTDIITYGKKLKPARPKTKRGKSDKEQLGYNESNDELNKEGSQRPSSSTVKGNMIGYVKPVAISRQSDTRQTKSVYDFNDDSPVRPPQNQNKCLQIQEEAKVENRVMERNFMMSPKSDSSGQDSSNSSPSLSVTEVFIRRRIRHEVKTPNVKDSHQDVALSDFLSTPTLTELFTDRNAHGRELQSLQTRNTSTVQRLAERRKLCDFNTEVIQTIQCSNKRRKYRV